VPVGGASRELVGEREAKQAQGALVVGLDGHHVPADGFGFARLVQETVALGLGEGFGDSLLRDRLESGVHGRVLLSFRKSQASGS
jgi:hypothetical protein